MKKNYVLLSGLILASSLGFAQSAIEQLPKPADALPINVLKQTPEEGFYKKKDKFADKAFRDTLFYEDFDGGIPTGWSAVNRQQNNYIWKWDTVAQTARFNIPPIASTTSSNGFMTLPTDFYNGGAGTPIGMDTYFESPTITNSQGGNFPDAVYFTYQQYLAYCCNSGNRLVLQVSTDNFATQPGTPNTNTYEFDATDDLPVNAANAGTANPVRINTIDISCAAGGEADFKFRILAFENTFYWWMIDDIAIIEGPANDIRIATPYMEFNEANYIYYPYYGQVPYSLFPPLPFFAFLTNNGSDTQTNVELNAGVDHLNTSGGGPATGQGNVYAISELVPGGGSIVAPLCDSQVAVLTGTPRFVPTVLGDFEVTFYTSQDSTDQLRGNDLATRSFSVTDTVFARDDGGFANGTGPGSYVSNGDPGGTASGDKFGTMYIIENRNGNGVANIPTSISYYVSDNEANIGMEISPRIWEYDEDSLFTTPGGINNAMGDVVASAFIPYVVTSSDTNSFITLKLTTGSAMTTGLDSGQYIVGWETVTLPTRPNPDDRTTFEVANDATSARDQSAVTTFMQFGHNTAAGWSWVPVNPVIRLNMGNLQISTGVGSNDVASAAFEVSPNPSNGIFKLNITTESAAIYTLNVRNMLGQTVFSTQVQVNGTKIERMDLSGLEKGVYFVTLENDSEKLLKKVVLK